MYIIPIHYREFTRYAIRVPGTLPFGSERVVNVDGNNWLAQAFEYRGTVNLTTLMELVEDNDQTGWEPPHKGMRLSR